jgi:hypothetical protein
VERGGPAIGDAAPRDIRRLIRQDLCPGGIWCPCEGCSVPRTRAGGTAGRVTASSKLPALAEAFEVVLLARNPDGSTSVGLHTATTGEARVTWPT